MASEIKFSLTGVEYDRWRAWKKAHCAEKHPNPRDSFGPIDVPTTFCFTGTGLGDHVEVVCSFCGDKMDVTEYESW